MGKLIKRLDKGIFFFLCLGIFYVPISISLIEISICSAILLFFLKKILEWKLGKKKFLPQSFLSNPILLYLVVIIFSIIFGSNFKISLKAFIGKTLEYILLYFVLIDSIRREKRIKVFLSVIVLSVFLINIDCLFQYFKNIEFLRQRAAVAGRVAGPFEFPDGLGNYLATILPVFMVLVFYKLKFRPKSVFYLANLIILLILLFLNSTRGAEIAFIVSFICLLFFLRKKKLLFLVPVVLVTIFFLLPVKSRGSIIKQFDIKQASFTQRLDLWNTSWRMFMDRPVLGQGLGTYMFNYIKFQDDRVRPFGEQGIWYAHNSYLQMLAETGLIGFISFFLIFLSLFKETYKVLRKTSDQWLQNLLLGTSLGLVAYLTQIIFDSTFYSLQNSVLMWYFLGFQVAIISVIKKEKS